jgi:hypothetical protein
MGVFYFMERIVWFKFDPVKWLTGRIQRTPAETQIAFIRLCCIYWANDCNVTMKRAMLEAGADHLDLLLEMEIVMENQNNLTIKFLDELYLEASEKSRKAKASAGRRWEKDNANDMQQQSERNANAMRTHTKGIADAKPTQCERNAEERRGEERREEITTTSLIVAEDAFNRKHAKSLIADNLFLGVAAMNNKVNKPDKVKDYIVSFHEHLAQEGKEHEKFSDFRKHFNNWLRIQTSQGIQPTHRYDQH